MGSLVADIFVTVGGKQSPERVETIKQSLASLRKNTEKNQYRLTACIDGPSAVISESFQKQVPIFQIADYVLISTENEGLGPTINRAVAHIKSINDWYSHPTHGDANKIAPFIVRCQDDLIYNPGWLTALASGFIAFEKTHKLGFASGVECIEHPVKKALTQSHVLKDWIRASQMMARREYWESMRPIPRCDPETGRVRAKPNDGMGSGVDWWLIRNHENSVCKTGRTNLVMPGLVVHAGYDRSTWLDRELPESDSDKVRAKDP